MGKLTSAKKIKKSSQPTTFVICARANSLRATVMMAMPVKTHDTTISSTDRVSVRSTAGDGILKDWSTELKLQNMRRIKRRDAHVHTSSMARLALLSDAVKTVTASDMQTCHHTYFACTQLGQGTAKTSIGPGWKQIVIGREPVDPRVRLRTLSNTDVSFISVRLPYVSFNLGFLVIWTSCVLV